MAGLNQVPESRQQLIVDAVKKKILTQPSLIAQHLGVPSGVSKLSAQQERDAYWTPDPEVQRDPQRFQNEAAAAAMTTAKEGESYDDTAARASMFFVHRLYPARLNIIRNGARALDTNAQIQFADDQEKLGPPEKDTMNA